MRVRSQIGLPEVLRYDVPSAAVALTMLLLQTKDLHGCETVTTTKSTTISY
ncbi:MAG: hypothetical protein H0U43_07380 [Chthoniobacterales bacterium]|nr:hypothetical protein [Chthoniobacterales bacterium]